ncbi:hypothetical protein D3C86_1632790 [compost metagenome]
MTDPDVAVPESSGARHAALLLHAMAPADRTWILEALPPVQRTGLQALLAELEALGIERDAALIADATASAAPVEPRQPVSDEDRLRTLNEVQFGEFVRLMRTEPVGLIAEWLRLADWPWRERLLAALEPGQRRQVEANLASTGAGYRTPPGMRAALISAAAARLQDHTPTVGAGPKTTWHELKRAFGRALRGGHSLSGGVR